MDSIERWVRRLERRMGATGPPSRAAHVRRLCERTGVPYRGAHDYRHGLRRGHCRMRGCQSRYAIVRVTIDTRDPERSDRSAVLECTLCGHVWTATRVPELRLHDGAGPRVLLTLILPPRRGEGRRVWYNRLGNPVWSGADAQTIRDATYTQLTEALAEHRERVAAHAARREAAKTAKAQAEAEDIRAHRERMADIEARLRAAGSPLV